MFNRHYYFNFMEFPDTTRNFLYNSVVSCVYIVRVHWITIALIMIAFTDIKSISVILWVICVERTNEKVIEHVHG